MQYYFESKSILVLILLYNHFYLFLKDVLIKKVSMFDGNTKYEAWIYSVGALKLLSGNSVVRKTIVNSGCIEALGIVLKNIIQQVKSTKFLGQFFKSLFLNKVNIFARTMLMSK